MKDYKFWKKRVIRYPIIALVIFGALLASTHGYTYKVSDYFLLLFMAMVASILLTEIHNRRYSKASPKRIRGKVLKKYLGLVRSGLGPSFHHEHTVIIESEIDGQAYKYFVNPSMFSCIEIGQVLDVKETFSMRIVDYDLLSKAVRDDTL